ncbi:heavy metal translocating P-type ATPase [Corynebacterium sp. 335C]
MVAAAAPDRAADARGSAMRTFLASFEGRLALATAAAIIVFLAASAIVQPADGTAAWWLTRLPLIAVVAVGGVPLIRDVVAAMIKYDGGADMLAAISIVTSVLLGEWPVAAIIVLMLSGGEALEEAASKRASRTLDAIAKRTPTVAHRLRGEDLSAGFDDVAADDVEVGDLIAVLPHELCPVDGEVAAGHGAMDESYLTGEPYVVSKSAGSAVMSGAVNGEGTLTVRATARAEDSRYAQIVGVLKEAEENRPPMRRLADRLGAWYTVVAVVLGAAGWIISGDPSRFLAVVVVATPCPLLIGVPVAIIGAISLSAKRGIIIRDPGLLERVSTVDEILFDKTGTLTYGRPSITEIAVTPGTDADAMLAAAAALEGYSRHPLAAAVRDGAAGRGLELPPVTEVAEKPGYGLVGVVGGREVALTSRAAAERADADGAAELPRTVSGMETAVLVDGRVAGLIRFRDLPRANAGDFLAHLPGRHGVRRTMILSGDRESEVRHLADEVGIDEVHAGLSPEDKLAIVRERTSRGRTLFLGDGINDAPAMTAATAGVAFGAANDVTTEAAGAVVLDSSLERLDDLLHIGRRMRRIALQSVIAGMGLSALGMVLAVFGLLPPLAGAIAQEVIDVLVVLNAARVALVRGPLSDFGGDDDA